MCAYRGDRKRFDEASDLVRENLGRGEAKRKLTTAVGETQSPQRINQLRCVQGPLLGAWGKVAKPCVFFHKGFRERKRQ